MQSRLARLFGMLASAMLCLPATAPANGWEHAAVPFDALVVALEVEHAETRRRAADSLGFRGQPEAFTPLVDALRRPERERTVRQAIYSALGRIGDPRGLAVLVSCLKEEPETLRATCAAATGALGDERGLKPLLERLTDDPSPLVRLRAIDGLGHFDSAKSIEALSKSIEAGDADVRLHAIAALGETRSEAAVGPLLRRLAQASSRDELMAIAGALALIASPEAIDVVESRLRETEDAELRAHYTVALAATRDGGVYPTLLEMVSDPSPTVRYVAIRGLHDLGRADAAGPLARMSLEISSRLARTPVEDWLRDPGPVVADLELQAASLRAIADLDAPAGLRALLAAARPAAVPRDSATALALAEGVYEVRRAAIHGLGYTGSRKAARYLASAHGIGDPDFRLRATAARSLGVLGFPGTGDEIEPLLSDPAAEVRWTAAMVLGRLKDAASAPALLASLEDRHEEVRLQAALGLGYLGDTTALPRLRRLAAGDESPRVREAASLSVAVLER